MKYGRLCFSNESISDSICNLGDIVQVFAIDEIYRQMNIPKEDIVDILFQDVATYQGEKIILPLNAYIKMTENTHFLPMSEDIIPVFLAINCTEDICKKYLDYFKKFEPIGCRDESTYNVMQKYGIKSYFFGCLTITLPRREKEPDGGKVFIVDLHPSAIRLLPKSIISGAEYRRQDLPLEGRLLNIDTAHEMEQFTRERYQELSDCASLVITSRLHIASPCLAMGVPVLLIRKGYDDRFAWIDRYTRLYDTNQRNIQINFEPETIEIEFFKKKLLAAACSVLRGEYDEKLLGDIQEFYLERKKTELKMSFMARAYVAMCKYAPGLANFIRDKLLFRFTISGSNLNANTQANKKGK